MQESRSEASRARQPESGQPAASAVPASFEEAYLQFALRLRKIAVRKFGIPPADAETLVHDVFATYFMHASSVTAVERYLVGAICNASRHYLRRTIAADAVFCAQLPCDAAPGEALLDEIERKLLLSRLLARVGGRCRDLLHRYYVNGETSRSIAETLHSTPGTVLVFLHKCRRRALAAYRSITEKS
jgi:DNA-directed RNA polymerase specialized sigma24 family protein